MTRTTRALLTMCTTMLCATAVAKVPFTNRSQFNVVPEAIMRSIGASTYTDTLSQSRVVRGTEDTRVLERVGRRISRAAAEPEYSWEYALLRDEAVNAWCLPGGKIGFYEGILPVLDNEAGMAFVMGHEVGHAVAHHGGERLTQNLAVLGGLAGLDLFLSRKTQLSQEQRGLIMGAVGLGAEVGVLLPFSRAQETEADIIGLMYMAKAGYPPEESIEVWDRMDALGGHGPAFLSTHPSNRSRKENLREWMPKAKKRYARNALEYDTLDDLWDATSRPRESGTDTPAPKTGGKGGGGKKKTKG